MICPKCKIVTPDELDVCYNCRTPLHPKQQSRAIWFWFFLLLIAVAGGAGYYYFYRMPHPFQQNEVPVMAPKAQTPAPVKKPSAPAAALPPAKSEISRPAAVPIKLTTGLVFIKDVTGKQLVQIPAAVLAGGWLALPKSECIGGYEWALQVSGKEFGVVGGIVDDLAQIGLWRIAEDQNVQGSALYPWAAGKPTAWYSLNTKDSLESVKITVLSEQGNFIKIELPAGLVEPGVFVQKDRVVGWTFGSLDEGAFMWKGAEGKDLKVELGVEDFYRLTFANSREEEFLLAMALNKEYSDLERLAALVNGFRFEPKLSPDNTPANLQPEAILANMRRLIAQSAQDEPAAAEVANTFDAEVLVQMADVELIRDVVQTTQEGYGYEEAVQLLEDVIDQLPINDKADADQLREIHSRLYQSWITSLTENDDSKAAGRVVELGRQNLPDDLDIHLLGVELALTEGNWAEAQKLLLMKEYPSSLRDRVMNLHSRISELKGQAGKIVIRFTPGSSQIPVSANLGQGVRQNFVVDTGASLVTIPQATAEKLDLAVDDSNPLRSVFTASGTIEVPEVVIPSIEINGWEVRNVRALVLDIPNQPELGLLGLNFLERFRMDLNSEKGILLLEPR